MRERILLVTYGADFQVLQHAYGGDPDLSPVLRHTGEMLRPFDSPMFVSEASRTVDCRAASLATRGGNGGAPVSILSPPRAPKPTKSANKTRPMVLRGKERARYLSLSIVIPVN